MKPIDSYEFLVIAMFTTPIENLRMATEKILQKPVGKYCISDRPLDLKWVYQVRPPSGGRHLVKSMMFEPECLPGQTVMIANLTDGWMTLCNVLSKQIKGEHILARSSIDDDYPVTDFQVWRDGVSVRYVRAFREESGWEFFERGDPQWYENLSNYKKRFIRDRLNREILISYLKKLGWNLNDLSFWYSRKNAVYIEEKFNNAFPI